MYNAVLGGLFDTEDTKRVMTAESLINLIKHKDYDGFISLLNPR